MKTSRLLKLFLALTTLGNLCAAPSALASYFSETEVDQNSFAVVAAPYRHGYNLLVLEQIPGQKPCWRETGASPTVIEPLFLEFDFTNSCIRSSDSNNYSIRFQGEDYGLDYLLNVVEKDDELHLIGTPRDSSKPEIYLGKTNGLSSGSLKIELDSEWRLTKRTYNGGVTAHLYLSNSPRFQNKNISQFNNNNDRSFPHNQPVNFVNYPVPQTRPIQEPTNYDYQQPVNSTNYSTPQPQPNNQPANYDYQQPVNSTNYSTPQPQPTNQPANYNYQQPVNSTNYSTPQPQPTNQPANYGYQQPVNSTNYSTPQPQPTNINYQK